MSLISTDPFAQFFDEEHSPRGGRASLAKITEALEVPTGSKIAKLEALLALQWKHPGDLALTAKIRGLVGFNHSIAEVQSCADYVRSMQSGDTVDERQQRAYVKLIAALENHDA